MVLRFAVMGNPIEHSLSPFIHQQFAEAVGCKLVYEKILIDLSRFEQQVLEFFAQEGKGLNITLPCKERAFAMAEKPTPRALQAGAANTLWVEAGQLYADNTDGVGFLRDITRYTELLDKAVLLLGAGGAARGIIGPLLASSPAELTIANRTLEKAQALQVEFPQINICTLADLTAQLDRKAFDIVIHATSLGIDNQNLDLPESLLRNKPLCYDLAYNRELPTPFVAWAQGGNTVAVDGLGMLVEQAAEAFQIWHGVLPNTASVLRLLRNPC